MDLSKLPKLSKTQTPPPAPAVESTPPQPIAATPMSGSGCPYCAAPLRAGARFCDSCGSALRAARDAGAVPSRAEAWVSIGIGIFLLLYVPTTIKYACSKVFHTKFAPYVDPETNEGVDYVSYTDGTKVHYRDQIDYWSNMAVTTFALALIVEGIALVLSRRPMVVLFALLVTVTATIFNLVYFLGTFNKYGIAPISALAVVFGGYMAFYQFSLLQSARSETRN